VTLCALGLSIPGSRHAVPQLLRHPSSRARAAFSIRS
jgi:hypothetical protein